MPLKSSTLEKLSIGQLQLNLAKHTKRFNTLLAELQRLDTALNELQEKKGKIFHQWQEKNCSIGKVKEQLLALEPLSQTLIKARNVFLHTAREAQSKDITIRRQEALEEEAEKLLKVLQGVCDHRFVFEYDGHKGFYSEDYEDQYCGLRRCAVCGFCERSATSKENIYSILTPGETRLIKRDLRKSVKVRHGSPDEEQLLLFLDEIQKMFLASAGLSIIDTEKDASAK